ncbi:tyrosinase family protein [Pseudomonas sp. LB3P31]
MDIRRNHRDMTQQQKYAFVEAILRLKNEIPSVLRPGQQNRYDDFVQIHKNSMGRGNPIIPNPHRSPLFYPWHRILIRQFELALQRAANDESMALPYWNWQIIGADNPFTSDFMGGNGDNMQNQVVTSGPFSRNTSQFDVRVWDSATGDTGLRRNFGAESTLPSAEAIVSALNGIPYWSEQPEQPVQPETPVQQVQIGWENFSEFELHNPVHAWIGGNMAEASSANDPIFFLHHCNLDRLWECWKRQHPTTPGFMSRDNSPNGVMESTLIFNPANEPAPWEHNYTVAQTLITEGLEYRYDYL